MNTRRGMWLGFAAALGFLAGCGTRPPEGTPEAATAPDTVHLSTAAVAALDMEIVTVAERPLPLHLEVVGHLASDTDRVFQASAPVSGHVAALPVALGADVRPGDALVTLASLAGGPPLTIRAPAGGVVVGLYVVPGERVEAGAPVAGVADLSTLRCVLDVFEQDIGRVRPGQPVEVTVVSAPGLVLPGRVTYISPRVDEETHAIKVRADVENLGGRLKFGMFVTARILVESRRGLAVPKVGVQTEGHRVFVLAASGPGKFERRWVTLGGESIRRRA